MNLNNNQHLPFLIQLSGNNQLIQTQNISSFNQQSQFVQLQPSIQQNARLLNPIIIQQQLNQQSSQPFYILNFPQQNSSINNNLLQFIANKNDNSLPVNSNSTQNIQINSNDIIEKEEVANSSKQTTIKSKNETNKFKFGKFNKNKKKVENTFVNEKNVDDNGECEKEENNSDVLYSHVCSYCKKKKKRFPSKYGLSCHLRDAHKLSKEKVEEITGEIGEYIDTDDLIAHLNSTALMTSKKCYTKEQDMNIDENKSSKMMMNNQSSNINNKSIYDKDNTEVDEFTDFKLIDKKTKKPKKQGLTSLQKRSSHLALNELKDQVDEINENDLPTKKARKSKDKEDYQAKINIQNVETLSIRTRSKSKDKAN